MMVYVLGYVIASTVVCNMFMRVRYQDDLHILCEFFLYYKVSLVYFIVSSIYFAARYISTKWMSTEANEIWRICTILYIWQSFMIFYVILLSIYCVQIIRVDLKWNATFGAMLNHTGDSVPHGIISPETNKMVNTVRIMAQLD